MTRRNVATQAHIKRAWRVAEKAGPHVAVDILPDGVIRLTQSGIKQGESRDHEKNPWDE